MSTKIPGTPLATDLAAVPVGSWAEYAQTSTGFTNTNRIAAVAKTADAITIESTRTGGLFGSDHVMSAQTFGLGPQYGRLLRGVSQVNSRPPDEWNLTEGTQSWYPRLDPQTFVGTEIVTVRAGTFTTRHHRYLTPDGDSVDAWMDEAVWPIGLVRLEAKVQLRPFPTDDASRAANVPSSPHHATFVFELIARGDGAAPRIAPPGGPSP